MSKVTINILTGETTVDEGYVAPSFDSVENKRADASMSRTNFCLRLMELGILPPTEAVQAAKGEWPATFAAFTSGLDATTQAAVEIDWAGAATIRYNAPNLQALALFNASGDQAAATALLDQIFNIT